MLTNIADFYNNKVSDKSIVTFIGEVTPVTIDKIMFQMEQQMDRFNEDPKIRKKLFNIFLESLQNLYHHTDNFETNSSEPSALCVINKDGEGYTILTGNYIKTEKVDLFKSQLEKINKSSKDDLRDYYLQVLNNGQRSDKDGAGLGMIEIARKTDDKLDFEFIPLHDNHTLFILNVKVLKKN